MPGPGQSDRFQSRYDPILGDPRQPGIEGEVLLQGQVRSQGGNMSGEADSLANPEHLAASEPCSQDHPFTLGRGGEGGEHPQQRALPGPVGPDYCDRGASLDRECDRLENRVQRR